MFGDQTNGFLQTRGFIHSGSSGGPVVNAAGDVVSVVSKGGGVCGPVDMPTYRAQAQWAGRLASTIRSERRSATARQLNGQGSSRHDTATNAPV